MVSQNRLIKEDSPEDSSQTPHGPRRRAHRILLRHACRQGIRAASAGHKNRGSRGQIHAAVFGVLQDQSPWYGIARNSVVVERDDEVISSRLLDATNAGRIRWTNRKQGEAHDLGTSATAFSEFSATQIHLAGKGNWVGRCPKRPRKSSRFWRRFARRAKSPRAVGMPTVRLRYFARMKSPSTIPSRRRNPSDSFKIVAHPCNIRLSLSRPDRQKMYCTQHILFARQFRRHGRQRDRQMLIRRP